MNATKRKFNALLQGLGSPRPDVPESSNDKMISPYKYGSNLASSNDAILAKRRRLGLPESTAPILQSPSPTATSFSNVVLKRSATQSNGRQSSSPPVKYCPGDRDELLKRLATFQEITDWTPKPDRINEVEWAKRGWISQGKEKVRCVLCQKELIVKLSRPETDGTEKPELMPSELGEALVDKYSELIVSSHQQDCLWRRRGCDDSLLRLSFSNALATLTALRQRYDELCSRSSFLPYEFNLRLPNEVDLDLILSQLPPDFFTKSPPVTDKSGAVPRDKHPNRVALALALMGWQGLTNSRIGAVPNSASCHTCVRRLGLWMFKSKEVNERGQVLVPAPMDHLDPLREHRFFCPWKNGLAQDRGKSATDKGSGLPAWRSLIQMIKNESELRKVYAGKSTKITKTTKTVQIREEEAAPPKPPPKPTRRNTRTSESPLPPLPIEKDAEITSYIAPKADARTDAKAEDEEKAREVKDKERWARLRRVKSLFDPKRARKSRRESSRPGTRDSDASMAGA